MCIIEYVESSRMILPYLVFTAFTVFGLYSTVQYILLVPPSVLPSATTATEALLNGGYYTLALSGIYFTFQALGLIFGLSLSDKSLQEHLSDIS